MTHAALVEKIVNGLPEWFDTGKSTLRLHGKNMSIEDLCKEIKSEARILMFQD